MIEYPRLERGRPAAALHRQPPSSVSHSRHAGANLRELAAASHYGFKLVAAFSLMFFLR